MTKLDAVRRRLSRWIDPDDPDDPDIVFVVQQAGQVDVYGPAWTFPQVRRERPDADRIHRKTVLDGDGDG